MAHPLILYGSTGHALAFREFVTGAYAARGHTIVAYIDDYRGDSGHTVDGIPVISFARWEAEFRAVPVFVTLGDPAGRRRLVERIEDSFGRFETFPGYGPGIARDFQCGEGSFLCTPLYIGPNVQVGRHAQLQPMLFLGHDCVIGDFVTISAARIAGYVTVEDEAFIGIGATILHGTPSRPIVIGRGAIVGAGAVVTKSVRPGARVLGNPARELRELAADRRRKITGHPRRWP